MYKVGPNILALNYEDITWRLVCQCSVNMIMTCKDSSLEKY